MRITEKCVYCGKLKEIDHTEQIDTVKIIKFYKCGHAEIEDLINADTLELDFTSVDGTMHARDYQKEAIKKAINNDLNFIVADQMRLGKTPTALFAVKNQLDKAIPCLVVVRSANVYQWQEAIKQWVSADRLSTFIITTKVKNFIPDGFSFYIVSMDSLRVPGMVEGILSLGIKCVIADEAHSFKNPESTRSQTFVQMLERGDIKHKLLLTGTPIKNRADEFFTLLNLVAPTEFPSRDKFRKQWLQTDSKGNYSNVSRQALPMFKERISPFYIRREKEDVFTELPPLNRVFTVIQIEDARLKKAYNEQMDVLEKRVVELEKQGRQINYQELQGNLLVLRRICGMAKVSFATDYIELFLEENETAKLAVGIHHVDVREYLRNSIDKRTRVMEISGKDSAEAKFRIMKDFELPANQVLIANMVAAGVGMDFHYCHNVLCLERMWSSADEEQFEFRFYNPDINIMGRGVSTTVEYPVAAGTVDQNFYDMVEYKRHIFGATLSNNWDVTRNPENFRELLDKTLGARL